MDYVSKSNAIVNEEISAKNDFSAEKFVESKPMTPEVSQIEKELSNSMKLLESGLSNLDIEAAHFLNQPRFKHSFAPKEDFLPKTSKKPLKLKNEKIKFSRNYSIISLPEQTQDSSYHERPLTTSKMKNVSVPPDLTFSFYSSVEEVIPLSSLMTQNSQIKSEPSLDLLYSSSRTNDDIYQALDEILNRSAESIFSNRTKLDEEETNNHVPNFYLDEGNTKLDVAGEEKEDDLEKKRKLNLSDEGNKVSYSDKEEKLQFSEKEKSNNWNEKTETSVDMDDLVESLLKIRSALDDLDKEAAHIMNSPGIKTPGDSSTK